MTIQEAIDRVDMLKPNHFSDEQKISWLSSLDWMVRKELVDTHVMPEDQDDFSGYDNDTVRDTVLLIPEPYTDVYQYWLMCQIDLGNAEINKYNNDKALYNASYQSYCDYFNRSYLPKQKSAYQL